MIFSRTGGRVGKRGRGGKAGSTRKERPAKSAADLDAEMEVSERVGPSIWLL